MGPVSTSSSAVGRASFGCLRRSASLSQKASPSPTYCLYAQQRHASSYRRQRKELNIPPAPAFGGPSLPTGSSGHSRTAKQQLPPTDHIIFNPPSSAPNVYHTPPKFLPDSDPRKKLYQKIPETSHLDARVPAPSAASAQAPPTPPSPTAFPSPLAPLSPAPVTATGTNYTNSWPAENELPPALTTPYEKKYHLTPEDFEEMRRLRRSDEEKWTRTKLAKKFGCTQFFAGLVVQASPERLEKLQKEEEEYAYRWRQRGGVSLKTRKERQKRRAAWMAEA